MPKPRKALLFTTAIVLFASPLVAQDTEIENGHEVKAHQVILRLSNTAAAVLQQLKLLGDSDDFRQLSGNFNLYLLHSKSANVTALLNVLKNHPAVSFIEPDYIVRTDTTPNDTYFGQQWALLNTGTPGADIGATSAWSISTGSTANVAGVVDTGIDYNHPDLAANVWSAPSQFTVTLSWGRLTCPAGSHGYNAIAHTCDPMDDNNHGTHVSGTIGAVANNAAGVAGVNWATRIMGLKFMDSTGSGSTSDAIDAMEFALQAKSIFGAAANVRVFSASWGGSGNSQSLLNEINKANTSDVLFVAAAGNSSQNVDSTPSYPAAYNAANLISVAATTNTDGLASFSNYGRNTIHLGAPGTNILSTVRNGSYAYFSGTSMATPHVSGAAMLVLAACSLNTTALKSTLLANVDPVASLAGYTVTGGRLDVNKAIRSCATVAPPPPPPPPTPTGTATFVKSDLTTAGTWKGAYGADGFNVINDTVSYPSYVAVTPSNNLSYTWIASTSAANALQKFSASDRIAACWYNAGSFSVDLSFKDTATHAVAFYLLDGDSVNVRAERIDILDGNGSVLDTRSASSFTAGQWLVWSLSGHVIVRFTNTGPTQAVLSGIFFGGASAPAPASGTAAFVKSDTTTAGSWKGAYGADGYNVINNAVSYPSYVSVTPSNNLSYTWIASTTAVNALQKVASTTDRIAACWYNNGSFSVDLAFKDTAAHQVAFYLLDGDSVNVRAERVDILDAGGKVLDTRSASSFTAGQWLVWNLSGHVVIRITNTGPTQAVLSGIFFGGASALPPSSSGTAAFVKSDLTTAGTWKGAYGGDGFNVINDTVKYPSYVTVTPSNNLSYTWIASTYSNNALQKAAAADRIAACWYSPTAFSVDLAFKDSNTHPVALYLLDGDSVNVRAERIDILDASGKVLDTRSVSSFTAGQWLVWNLSGHVIVRITNTGPTQAVLSGLFFGGASAPPSATGTASFVKTDLTTAGSWKGVYGADGFNVINDTVKYPSYVTVTPSSNLSYTWIASTTAVNALQKYASTTDRIAACWYNSTGFTVDLAFNDGTTHQVAFYLLDGDSVNVRAERIDILDGNGTLLDSRSASSFTAGQWFVWNLSGHVIVRITNTGPTQAVLSGIFFR
jgi:subtilisin family serine protease